MYNGVIAYECCDGAKFVVDFETDKIMFYDRDGVLFKRTNASDYACQGSNPLKCFDPAYSYMRRLANEGRL